MAKGCHAFGYRVTQGGLGVKQLPRHPRFIITLVKQKNARKKEKAKQKTKRKTKDLEARELVRL